ncbi:hypothetical protein ACFVX3_18520 [Rhodococcus erythropolis]
MTKFPVPIHRRRTAGSSDRRRRRISSFVLAATHLVGVREELED